MSKTNLIIAGVLVFTLIAGGFAFLKFNKKPQADTPAPAKRQVINALPISERPFVALFPHESNKLITLLLDKPGNLPELTIDIEYLSGNALKGGRTTISLPTELPHTQAFLLGSCSSGGKCSFDRDITTGTIKTKLEKSDEIHVLKSNYVFVDGPSATTDQKLRFEPTKYSENAILGYSHGYLETFDGEIASEPFLITSSSPKAVSGVITIISGDANGISYYDGSSYAPLTVEKENNEISIEINLKPWSREVTIIRDDLKGATEDTTLYLLGPFIPTK